MWFKKVKSPINEIVQFKNGLYGVRRTVFYRNGFERVPTGYLYKYSGLVVAAEDIPGETDMLTFMWSEGDFGFESCCKGTFEDATTKLGMINGTIKNPHPQPIPDYGSPIDRTDKQ